MKEKERLQKNQAKQIKANKNYNYGYKIKVSSSQIFSNSPGDNSLKEDTEDIKDIMLGEDLSSADSSLRRNSAYMSPDQPTESRSNFKNKGKISLV